MLLVLIHYGETNWVVLTVKIQYLTVAWVLHIECTVQQMTDTDDLRTERRYSF